MKITGGRAIFATEFAMHYSGGVRVGNSDWLAGWPCCCSGRRAGIIRVRGNQTTDVSKVDCKACLRQIERAGEP